MSGLNAIAEQWVHIFTIHMLEASVFILFIWIADRFLKMTTVNRYLLWLLALVKLMIPPVISLPGSIGQTIPARFYLVSTVQSTAEVAIPADLFLTPESTIFLLWLVCGFLLLGYILVKNMVIRWYLKDAEAVTPAIARNFNRLRVYQSSAVSSPLLLGIGVPRLYLPCNWRRWPDQALRSVVLHEYAHHRYHDIWVLVAQKIVLVLFGINPLVWLLHKRLNDLRETHCDEFAIAESGVNPIEYGKLIYDMVEQQSRRFAFLFGRAFSMRHRSIRNRINHILNFEEAIMYRSSLFCSAVLVVLAILIVPFSWNCSEQSNQESASSQQSLAKSDEATMNGVYDEPPMPVGGMRIIQENLHYPELARKAGIEGRVVLRIKVDENGDLAEVEVQEADTKLRSSGCAQAAVNAMKNIEWLPASYQGQPVPASVALPVIFRLENGSGDNSSSALE